MAASTEKPMREDRKIECEASEAGGSTGIEAFESRRARAASKYTRRRGLYKTNFAIVWFAFVEAARFKGGQVFVPSTIQTNAPGFHTKSNSFRGLRAPNFRQSRRRSFRWTPPSRVQKVPSPPASAQSRQRFPRDLPASIATQPPESSRPLAPECALPRWLRSFPAR